MALPPGISPKTVTIGVASFFDGSLADGTATITAPINVVHTPTNRPIFSSSMSQRFVDGVASFNLAPTDAPGLNNVSWTYKLNVTITGALVQPDPIYFTLPTAGPDTVDLDGLVTVPSSAGVPISVDVLTAEDITSPTSDVNASLRATLGPGRASTKVYADFTAAANGPIGGFAPEVGPAFTASGAQLPTISGGKATSAGTGYIIATLDSPPAELWAETAFTGSSAANIMTLAWSDSAIDNAVHLNYGAREFNVTVRKDGGTFDSVPGGFGKWVREIPTDGTTAPRVTAVVRGQTLTIIGPNGEVRSVNDPRIGQLMQSRVFWEPNTGGADSALLLRCGAVDVAPTGRPSPLLSPSDLPANFTVDQEGRLVGNPGTAFEVAIGRSPEYNQVAVEFGPRFPYSAQLTAAASAGATSIQTDKYIPNGSAIQIESGNGTETVTASGNSTGSSPYTTPVSALTKAHAVGVAAVVTVPSSYRATIFGDTFGGLTVPGPFKQGSGSDQFAFGGGPDGAGLYFGNAYDTGIFRADAGVMRLRTGTVLRVGSGTTAQRPAAATAGIGAEYYDTTLGKPIWSNGTAWRDATGTAA